ncbi:MAG: extracellular solute-binding protein [Actinomycetia bacterium]|nr:extracellular solute-binding protein [Actinomycetes bacterium]
MEFGILGPLQVIADGTALHVGGPKPRALLALLLIHANETVSAERLIDDLWDAQPPRSATATLQTYVSQLRKHVGTSTLLTTPNGYRLDVPRTHLDGARFEATLHEATQAHERNAALVAERLCDALQLWRGTALADFVGASWANGEAARLNGLRLVAIEARIDARLTLAEHTRLVPELEALIEVHTLRERLWGQLMLALYRCGRQADALRVCSRLRKLLKEELGI